MRRLPSVLALAAIAWAALACSGGGDEVNEEDASADPTTGADASATSSRTVTTTASGVDPLEAFEAIKIPEELADGDDLGNEDAPVTLTIYEDFQCPFCLALNLAFEAILVEEYVNAGTVRLEFRHYPVLGPESETAAMAGICAADQNVFWPLHNRLFLKQAEAGQLTQEQLNVGRFSFANLRTYAVEAGADAAAWEDCMADPPTEQRLQADVREARSLGLRGTPSLLLNGTPIATPRDADELRTILDLAIADAR